MTFSEFANMLYPFCGKACKTSDFVLFLVENIMEDPANDDDVKKAANDEYNPLAKLDVGTLEKFFNGNSKISQKNASAVIAHLDKERFSEYINSFSVDTLSLLGEALQKRGSEIDIGDVPNKCAELFTSILKDLAERKKASAILKNANASFIEEISMELVPALPIHRGAIPESDLFLLLETNSSCPLCGKSLVGQKNSNGLAKYKITNIIPTVLSETQKAEFESISISTSRLSSDGKIALCFDCENKYTSNTTKDECLKLISVKEKLNRNSLALEALDKLNLEEQIETVIRQIASASQDQLSDELNYNAVRIKEKIEKSNVPLLMKVQGFVIPYYNFIKSVFSQLEREAKLNFEDVANDVQRSYKKLQAEGLSQDEIYKNLVDWFNKKTNAQNEFACEIIVAFFVQNCEVFHAVTQ